MNHSIGTNEISVDNLSLDPGLVDNFGITTLEDMGGNLVTTSSVQKFPNDSTSKLGCGHNMPQQSGLEQVFIIKDGVEGIFGHFGKSFISGSKDGERSISLQSLNKAGFSDGSKQSAEPAVGSQDFSAVFVCKVSNDISDEVDDTIAGFDVSPADSLSIHSQKTLEMVKILVKI